MNEEGFTMLHKQQIEFYDGKSMFAVNIVVDTVPELPTPKKEWAAGSMAFVTDTPSTWILNHKGEWKQWQ